MTALSTLPTMQNITEPTGIILDAEMLAPSALRVVLLCDVVESVRWMEHDEDYAVSRWQAFTHQVRSTIVPEHGGSVVKSTGDGMMIEFATARGAVQAAVSMHALAAQGNMQFDPSGQAPERHLLLRTGIHETHARRDAHDIYGHGVNLVARITTLAGPGETIVTAAVRDHLTESLDGDIEDMGECYLKHVSEPQRVFRVGAGSTKAILIPVREYAEQLEPTIAIIPFESRAMAIGDFAIGELIADGVISELGKSPYLEVISRLSTTAFKGAGKSAIEIGQILKANYVLSGTYLQINSGETAKLVVTAELSDTIRGVAVWTDRFPTDVGDLLSIESMCIAHIVERISALILNHEAKKTTLCPLPTLSAYSLQLSGICLTHRSNTKDFEMGREVLTELTHRHSRMIAAHAWLAKWYVLRVIRGMSQNSTSDKRNALDSCKRALEINPEHPLALTVYGYVLCQIAGDIENAQIAMDRAIQLCPSDMHAWLFRSVLSAHTGENQRGVVDALQAVKLSPADPHRYFLDTVVASAYAFNDEHGLAILNADKALRLDSTHAPALRVKLLAEVESDQMDAARITGQRLLKLLPSFSIQQYQTMGSENSPARQRVIAAMKMVGLPETG